MAGAFAGYVHVVVGKVEFLTGCLNLKGSQVFDGGWLKTFLFLPCKVLYPKLAADILQMSKLQEIRDNKVPCDSCYISIPMVTR